MRPILRDAILTALEEHGTLRGSTAEFAVAFECDESEASQCLSQLMKEGYILRATGLGSSRSVYSLSQEVVSAPAYKTKVAQESFYRSLDALPVY